MKIAVVDGQGGGIGRALVEKIKGAMPEATVLALGTNSVATGIMLRAGANQGATGENAIVYNMQTVDVVVGVISIIAANSMMGELTPAMATAISGSAAPKILLPLDRCGIHVAGLTDMNLSRSIEDAVEMLRQFCEARLGIEK